MGMRQTDERISQKADRLHLTFLRDHLPEVLESIMAANMTTREAFDFAFGKEIEQRESIVLSKRYSRLISRALNGWKTSISVLSLPLTPVRSRNWPSSNGLVLEKTSLSLVHLV